MNGLWRNGDGIFFQCHCMEKPEKLSDRDLVPMYRLVEVIAEHRECLQL